MKEWQEVFLRRGGVKKPAGERRLCPTGRAAFSKSP